MRAMYSPNKGSHVLTRFIMLTFLLFALLLPAMVNAGTGDQVQTAQVANPGTDLWRDVRQRNQAVVGSTQVRGVESAILINPYGDQWRQFRMQQLIPYGGSILGGVIVLLILFYLIRGRVPVEGGPSDKKLFRYSSYERTIHWFIASIFIFLALSGLILLFGRSILLPLLGAELFSLIASASKEGHNLFGPLFALALILVFVKFVRRNIYARGDMTWLLKGGGVIGKSHVPSGFFNMGEKSMFWLVVFGGGAIAASGFILVLPYFGQGREIMELSHLAHGVSAIVLIAVILGHIYIGTIGMEGAIDGMRSGYCDLNWAKEHHDHWATEVEAEAIPNEEAARMSGDHPDSGEQSKQMVQEG